MRKKHPLTLLEVMITMLLVGFLLTGLFQIFRNCLKHQRTISEIKQTVLHLEMFQQKMRTWLAIEDKVWIDKHPDSVSSCLFVQFERKADPDPTFCGTTLGMLYLNKKQELCLASWSQTGSARVETLLNHVNTFECGLFDPKNKVWCLTWPKNKEELPKMVKVTICQEKDEISFVFFLPTDDTPISYPVKP